MKNLRFGICMAIVLLGAQNLFSQDTFKEFKGAVNAYWMRTYVIYHPEHFNDYFKDFPDGITIIRGYLKEDCIVLQKTVHGFKYTVQDSTIAARWKVGQRDPFSIDSCNNEVIGIWYLNVSKVPLIPRGLDRMPLSPFLIAMSPVALPVRLISSIIPAGNIFPSRSFIGSLPWWSGPLVLLVGGVTYFLLNDDDDDHKQPCPRPELDCP